MRWRRDENGNKRIVLDGRGPPNPVIRNRDLSLMISRSMCKGPAACVWQVSGGWAVSTHCCVDWPLGLS